MQACPSCRRFLMGSPDRCPFCETLVPPSKLGRVAQTVGASATAVVLAACYGGADKWTGMPDSGDSAATTTDPSGEFGPEDVDVTLSSTGVTLEIRDTEEVFFFGMAPNCDSSSSDCWVAESCVEGQGGYEVCHGVSATGATLTKVETPGEVVSGATTLIDNSFEGQLGYVLMNESACYTWGDNKQYYVDALGCTAW